MARKPAHLSTMNTNYLRFVQLGTSTAVQIDPDELVTAFGFSTMVTLNNIAPAQLSQGTNILV
jgi:hypothetical protein